MVNKRLLFIWGMVFVLVTSCTSFEGTRRPENIWKDPGLREIADLQNMRNTERLIPYLSHSNPQYRRIAALSFASVQDKKGLSSLQLLLKDSNRRVRLAAAYAIGQIKDVRGELSLLKAYEKEKNIQVKWKILEALGKCGSHQALHFLLDLEEEKIHPELLSGVAYGIYRLMLKDVVSPKAIRCMAGYTNLKYPKETRFIAANYLSRLKHKDLSNYEENIISAIINEASDDIRIPLVKSLGKSKTPKSYAFLKKLSVSDESYLIKVNAIRALSSFDYGMIKEILLDRLLEKNHHISRVAADILFEKGIARDAKEYYHTAMNAPSWYARARTLECAYRLSLRKSKLRVSLMELVQRLYKKSTNPYEKAQLIRALIYDSDNLRFVSDEALKNVGNIIGTSGFEALVENVSVIKKNKAHKRLYADILKKAIESKDAAIVATVSPVFRDPELELDKIYGEMNFLKEVLRGLRLPRDIEAYMALSKTVDILTGSKTENAYVLKPEAIDWELIQALKVDQKIGIKTNRGEIVVELAVNDAPFSVANFIKLIKSEFYNGLGFHRVVPGFVIQGGCPRGDGYGAPDYIITSEFGPSYYEKGALGMASAGKDTEGCQFFITHIPTPHLDGRYSLFGKVISGLEVVDRIKVGDKILGFSFL